MGIVKSAGLVIVQDKKILLLHPTNAAWQGTYSIPKGEIEDFETPLDAAIRETREEIGIEIKPEWVEKQEPGVVLYKNKRGKTYKKVFWYVVDLDKVNITVGDKIPKENLQVQEVDWAGFLSLAEAKEKIFWRFLDILTTLDFYFKIREKI